MIKKLSADDEVIDISDDDNEPPQQDHTTSNPQQSSSSNLTTTTTTTTTAPPQKLVKQQQSKLQQQKEKVFIEEEDIEEEEEEPHVNIQFHNISYKDSRIIALKLQDILHDLKQSNKMAQKQQQQQQANDENGNGTMMNHQKEDESTFDITIYANFVLDKTPNPSIPDHSSLLNAPPLPPPSSSRHGGAEAAENRRKRNIGPQVFDMYNGGLVYERSVDRYVPFGVDQDSAASGRRDRRTMGNSSEIDTTTVSVLKCFNCGRPDHELKDCPFPFDHRSFRKNKDLFLKYQASRSRYVPTGGDDVRYFQEENNEENNQETKQKQRSDAQQYIQNYINQATKESAEENKSSSVKTEEISNSIYENRPHLADMGSVTDEFLFGGSLPDDPERVDWKNKFGSAMGRLREHKEKHAKDRGHLEQQHQFIQIEKRDNSSKEEKSLQETHKQQDDSRHEHDRQRDRRSDRVRERDREEHHEDRYDDHRSERPYDRHVSSSRSGSRRSEYHGRRRRERSESPEERSRYSSRSYHGSSGRTSERRHYSDEESDPFDELIRNRRKRWPAEDRESDTESSSRHRKRSRR